MAAAAKSRVPQESGVDSYKDWDEARIQMALARIQNLQTQLRQLRNTVPSLLHPIKAEHTSPETLYAKLESAANKAATSVKDFQGEMRDARTKEILGKVKEIGEHGLGGGEVESWLVSSYPDWLDQPALRNANGHQSEDESHSEEKGGNQPQESIEQIVQKFSTTHEKVDIKLDEQNRKITMIIPQPGKITFTITWESPKDGQTPSYFKATTKNGSKLLTAISQFLQKRPRADDLSWTLEMLDSYLDIRNRRCDKCNKTTDFASDYTVVREGEVIKNEDSTKNIKWKAYHPSCSS